MKQRMLGNGRRGRMQSLSVGISLTCTTLSSDKYENIHWVSERLSSFLSAALLQARMKEMVRYTMHGQRRLERD